MRANRDPNVVSSKAGSLAELMKALAESKPKGQTPFRMPFQKTMNMLPDSRHHHASAAAV
ncbi:MAG: hypothetical protein AAGF29_09890 [Pseudomonadota bacterium]